MKIGYLISAYNNPEQLARLISRLDGPHAEFFIHIDKKYDITPFLATCRQAKNISWIKHRFKVYWRGYGNVKAALALLEEAMKRKVDYYILLSGSDYPIKTNQYIIEFLSNADHEYISFFALSHRPEWLKKVEQYFYWDSKFTNLIDGFPATRGRLRRLQKKIAEILPKRKFLKGLYPYGGSCWWMLTQSAAEYVVQFAKNNKRFCNFYKYTDAPDEMFFQTILLNSPLAKKVVNWETYQDEAKREKLHSKWPCPASVYNFRYTDWTRSRADGAGHPIVLDIQDYKTLKTSYCLFARKFHPGRSKELLELIDSNLLAEQSVSRRQAKDARN